MEIPYIVCLVYKHHSNCLAFLASEKKIIKLGDYHLVVGHVIYILGNDFDVL